MWFVISVLIAGGFVWWYKQDAKRGHKLVQLQPAPTPGSTSRRNKTGSSVRLAVTATDESGNPVGDRDPRVVEVTEHPVFVELAPMLAQGDWGAARRFLQKIAYGINTAPPDDQRIFKKIMTIFAAADPLYQQCMRGIRPFIEENPGIKQTALYPHMAAAPDTEHCRYVLYFADELGEIVRRKKGNSYEVFLPGQAVPTMPVKAKRS
jgi:hypothetical protein